MITTEYRIGNKIDWKEIKSKWDASPLFFVATFWHGERKLEFCGQLNQKKQCKLMLYIDGVFEGTYLNKEHPYSVYLNPKKLRPTIWQKSYWELQKKEAKRKKQKWVQPEPGFFLVPIFDNIAQIKRMIENLPKT